MGEAETVAIRPRKRKEKPETENPEGSPEKKAKNFCSQTFRQELKGSEALKSLKRFISAAKSSDEIIFDYLESGGSLQEILSLLDSTAKGDLTTALPVFEVVHLILLRFQSSDSKHHQRCIDSARTILRSHLFIIKAMLAMNITKHKKVALKLLTAIVTLDSSFANEIMNVVALAPTLIADLIQPSPEKESVRKCFVLFVLSFLIEGNLTVVKNLLDKKGFLSSIIPGLKFDEASTVNLTLTLLEEKVLKNIKIAKTLKLKIFNTQIIKSLFDLYDWKGLQGVKQILPKKKNKVKGVEVNQGEKEVVTECVHSFLLLLCCSQKYGVAFYDKSLGTSEQLNNQLLLTVFESIPDPLKNPKMAEVVLKTIASCPDLMKPVLLKIEPSFQPRNSKNWFQAVDFAENLIKAVDAVRILKSEGDTLTPSLIIKVGKVLVAPLVFLRVVKVGSEKSQPMQVRLHCLKLLTTISREVEKLLVNFRSYQDELKKTLHKHVFKFLPDAGELVELWQNLCDAEVFSNLPFSHEERVSLLTAVLDSLHVIAECKKEAVSSPLALASDLLRCLEGIKEGLSGLEFDVVQVKIVQFVGMELRSLTPDMELFDKSLRILLHSTDASSLPYLSKILSSLEIFASNPSEVDVWLLSYTCLPREYRTCVAECLIDALRLSFNRQTKEDVQTTSEETFTPLLSNCVELFKSHSSKSSKKDEKLTTFRNYLNDVAIHLQHFYIDNIHLYDLLKDVDKILAKPTLNYLKGWKNNSLRVPGPEVLPCPLELALISWLVDDSNKPGKLFDDDDTNLLKMYSMFRTVVAYLTKKVISGNVSQNDVEKFGECLLLFLGVEGGEDADTANLISQDITNAYLYRKHCLDCLFRNQHLLNDFDVFQKKQNSACRTTAIVFKVLMEKETRYKRLSEPWKLKFLKQLKAKLKKNKSIDGLSSFEPVLNFFEYDSGDVAEMVQLLSSVSADLDVFVNGNVPSTWIVVLSKFVKMHCEVEELGASVLTNLCRIMKHLNDRFCSNLEGITGCFVYLLRRHPRHLLLVDDEFLDVVLLSKHIAAETLTLGKLLLNDPNKVQHFLKFVTQNLEDSPKPEVAFSLLSTLIDENLYLTGLETERTTWKLSEVNQKTTPELFNALEVIYKKFEGNILAALAGQTDEVVLQNLGLARGMIKLYTDKKKLGKMRGEILKGRFEPELALEAVRKVNVSAVTEEFTRGLLSLFCRVLGKPDDAEEVDWSRYCSVVVELVDFNKKSLWEGVVRSSEWREFAKLSLGYCLTSTKHPSLLKILHILLTNFHKDNVKDCDLFFHMLISHSQFLKVMLTPSPLKTELVELFHSLIQKCPSEMSPKHFPILLAAYTAGLSPCDRTLLKILKLYERIGVGDYEPFVWGETAVSHYSIGTSPGLSLWQRFHMGNVLDLLDGQRLELSLREFPILRGSDVEVVSDYDVYDPAFLLPLFVNLLSPGAVVLCLSFIYKGGLAYTVRALSSECKDVRLMASVVLSRFYNHLELSQNLKQKLVWMHFINCFRFGIEDLSAQPLPNVATLFFAKMSLVLSSQPAEMYTPLQNFLLAKSYFAFDTVPEFFPLFHSSEVSHWKHREWLLEVIRDGTKTESDVKVIFHSMALKIVFCFFCSQLCSAETKRLILQVIERMIRIDKSALLISEYGLLDWITSTDPASLQPVLPDLLSLLHTLTRAIVKDVQTHKSKHSNSSHLIQILNMAVKLLPSLKCLKSVEAFKVYLKIITECFVVFVKDAKSDWFKINKNRLADIVDAGVVVMGKDCGKFSKVPFYFRDLGEDCCYEDLKKAVFVFSMLINRQNNK